MEVTTKIIAAFDLICSSFRPYICEVPDKGIKIAIRFEKKRFSFPGIDISRGTDNGDITVCVTNCKRSLACTGYIFKNEHGMFLLNAAVQKVGNDTYIVKYDILEVIKPPCKEYSAPVRKQRKTVDKYYNKSL